MVWGRVQIFGCQKIYRNSIEMINNENFERLHSENKEWKNIVTFSKVFEKYFDKCKWYVNCVTFSTLM